MIATEIILDADGSLEGFKNKITEAEGLHAVTALEAGTGGGFPSVAFVIKLKGEDKYIFAETSLRMFLTAAKAFEARYGHP